MPAKNANIVIVSCSSGASFACLPCLESLFAYHDGSACAPAEKLIVYNAGDPLISKIESSRIKNLPSIKRAYLKSKE